MLTNLLPGFRHLRTPLASGYIWLVAVWFAFHGRIPTRKEATGLVGAVYELTDLVGRPGTMAAVSFIAFLIGSQLLVQPACIRRLIESLIPANWPLLGGTSPDEDYLAWYTTFSRGALLTLDRYIKDLDRSILPDGASARPRYAPDPAVAMGNVIDELNQLAIRLQVGNADVFADYDRTKSEADFRVNVGLAVGALSFSLAYASGRWLFLAGLVITLVMIRDGVQRNREANDLLIQALVTGVITSASLADYDRELRKALGPRTSNQAAPEEPCVPSPAS